MPKSRLSSRLPVATHQRTGSFKKGEQVGIILGAGATKACDGPLTAEILSKAFEATKGKQLELLDKFLQKLFSVPPAMGARKPGDYPPLPTVLSLLDTAISREHDFGHEWPTTVLRQVRRQTEYSVFRAIAYAMRKNSSWANRCHEDLITAISTRTGKWPSVVSLNYDLRIDYAMIETDQGGLPDYGCDIRTPEYQRATKFGQLFKIHGSMHWLYCPTCHRLEMGIDKEGRLRKAGLSLAWSLAQDFVEGLSEKGLYCPDCKTRFRTVMITPTSLKDYRNPHIASLWYQAERALRQCNRVIFVGYSLPWDDVDVIYLLKRGLSHLRKKQITVVEWAEKTIPLDAHEVGQRYKAVFGRGLDWQPLGFVEWVKTLR
jgi:hypothetical protein